MRYLIEGYADWLHTYKPKNCDEKNAHQKICLLLTKDVMLNKLIDEFDKILKTSASQLSSDFKNTLVAWSIELTEIQSQKKDALTTVNQLAATYKLMLFCQQLLAYPMTAFHINIFSTLNSLKSAPEVKAICDFLQTLPDNPKPPSTSPATFEAQKPTDEYHAHSLKLLRKNSAFFAKARYNTPQYPLTDKANSLLQNLLIIHHDKHHNPPELPEREAEDNRYGCGLM